MRLTLEQLKAMSDDDLKGLWDAGKFPFDTMRSCRCCITMHWSGWCGQHGEVTTSMQHLVRGEDGRRTNSALALRINIEELYALRLFYDSLYPQTEATPGIPGAVAIEASNVEVVDKSL